MAEVELPVHTPLQCKLAVLEGARGGAGGGGTGDNIQQATWEPGEAERVTGGVRSGAATRERAKGGAIPPIWGEGDDVPREGGPRVGGCLP